MFSSRCALQMYSVEVLEGRLFLSAHPVSTHIPPGLLKKELRDAPMLAHPIAMVQAKPMSITPPGTAMTPSQIRHAYGVDQVMFGSVQGDGAGQTIAIIDAYDYPTAWVDLQAFDSYFGLPDPPSFQRVSQTGSTTNLPGTDPAGPGAANGTWELEAALDLQWAHSLAPKANLILVEANSPSFADLVQSAANWARSQPGVTAISMSFGAGEFVGETSFDSYFTTPAGHAGVTFLASTGDAGKPGSYPAYSPNVVAVGGTTLNVSGTNYVSETGWSGSGGGISTQQPQPSWQGGIVTQSATQRTIPDVSMDADPNTGVAVYDSWDYPTSPWLQIGGTSLSSPMWAGLIAVANQGRALAGLSSLNGATETLPKLYQIPASDYHDILSGNNGFAAAAGYDLVTGRGTPFANKLIADLVGVSTISGTVFQDNNSNGLRDAGEPALAAGTVYVDSNNNGFFDSGSTSTTTSTNVPLAIPDNNAAGANSTLNIAGVAGLLSDVNITFSITHPKDSNLTGYLIGPDGTQITLFTGLGGKRGQNFTGTTLDDEAGTSITSASAPFSGTYRPSPGFLSAFDGKSANGTWQFKVVDSVSSNTGSITSWSLTLTAAESSTTTDASGNYTLSLAPGTYLVRAVLPANSIQTTPAAGAGYTVTGSATGRNFANFPTVINDSSAGATYYATMDASQTYLQISKAVAPTNPPMYQVRAALLPGFSFNLGGSGAALYVDYANGTPAPLAGMSLTGASATALHILGTGRTFNLGDTSIAAAGDPPLSFASVDALYLFGGTYQYNGTFSGLSLLVIDGDAVFYF